MSTNYNPLIPTGLINLDTDYKNIQNNFAQLDTTYGFDHVKYSVAPNNGFHKQVTLLSQSDPGLRGGDGVYYTDKVGLVSFPTFRNSDGAYFMNCVKPKSLINGYTSLFGNPGIIIQWGKIINPGSSGTVTFTDVGNINFPNTCFNVQLTLQRDSGNQSVTIDESTPPGTTGFKYLSSSSNSSAIYWIAIGI